MCCKCQWYQSLRAHLTRLEVPFVPGFLTVVFSFAISQVLNEMVGGLQEIQGISRVLYDLTAKPPGTTEWE